MASMVVWPDHCPKKLVFLKVNKIMKISKRTEDVAQW